MSIKNSYCKLKHDFDNCPFKTFDNTGKFTGIECPDCKHCKIYRYLPQTLKIGDTIEFVGSSKKCVNRYGGKFEIPILTTGKITGNGFSDNEYSVKRNEYPFTSLLLHRNRMIRLIEENKK